MFIMPMPPTSRAMDAMPASIVVIMPVMLFIVSSRLSKLMMEYALSR